MKFETFLKTFRNQPVVDSQMLAPFREGNYGAVQLSRWVKEGKLVQLRRGFYTFTPNYLRVEPSALYIANMIYRPSYISLERALAEYGLIPESVPVITSVTTRRPTEFESVLGHFRYQHIKQDLFFGYYSRKTDTPETLLAFPEKAILDLMYFTPGPLTMDWMEEMRFQNLEEIHPERLLDFSKRFNQPKIQKAAALFLEFRRRILKEYKQRQRTKS